MIGMTPDSLCSLMFLTLLIPNLVLAQLGKYLVCSTCNRLFDLDNTHKMLPT